MHRLLGFEVLQVLMLELSEANLAAEGKPMMPPVLEDRASVGLYIMP